MARSALARLSACGATFEREVGADGALAFLMTLSGMFSRLAAPPRVFGHPLAARNARRTHGERPCRSRRLRDPHSRRTPLAAQNRFILESSGVAEAQVATAPHGMVVSQEKRATEIGLDVLARGGNAVDAAVAVGFALAVTLPKAGNIGGGGFMVVHLADRHEDVAIDYREAAPGGGALRHFPRARGPGGPQEVPRHRARRRRAGHRRRAFARARASTAPASSPSPT